MGGVVRRRIGRREGESLQQYRQRTAEIDAIAEGFRWGRFDVREAERMEARLDELLAETPGEQRSE